MFIKDPRTGNAQRITDQGRAMVEGPMISRLGHISDIIQSAYSIYGRINLTLTATDQYLLFIQNDSDDQLHISNLTTSTNGSAVKVEGHLNGTRTSGGVVRTPLNMNRYSGNIAALTIYDGGAADLVCAVPAGQAGELIDMRLSTGFSTYTHDFKDALILKKNDTFIVMTSGT